MGTSRRDAIVSAWLEDVRVAYNQQISTTPSPASPLSRKRKALSPSRIRPDQGAVLTQKHSVMDDSDSRVRQTRARSRAARAAGNNVDAAASSSDDASGGQSLDEAEQLPPGSPTPRRPVIPGRLTSPERQVAGAVGAQRAGNPLPPARSLSFPRSTTSNPSSATSAYSAAISHRPHPSNRTTLAMTIPSLLPSESGSSRRSRSPVKGMANLEFAERPVRVVTPKSLAQIPEDIRTLCEEVSRIRDGVAVIPASIREEVDNMMKSIRLFAPPVRQENLDQTSSRRRKRDLLHELDTLAWVVRDSERASVGNLCEAHWNDRVHAQLLAAAIERDIASPTTQSHGINGNDDGCTVSVFNCTQAKIAASCVPRHASKGIDLEAKMVDYCISIRDSDIERTARHAVQSQLWKPTASTSSSAASSSAASVSSAGDAFSSPRKRKAPTPLQSINHTEYDPLCLAPITVSIETKKPGGSEDGAKAQLSVWASAQILRLRQLLGDPEKPLGITFPLLLVTGPTWQLLFAVEKEDRIEILHQLELQIDGGSNSLMGCYKLLALLRALRRWSETTFRTWFLEAFAEV